MRRVSAIGTIVARSRLGNQMVCSQVVRCRVRTTWSTAVPCRRSRRGPSPRASTVAAPRVVSWVTARTSASWASRRSYARVARGRYHHVERTANGTPASRPSPSSGEVIRMAAKVKTRVTAASAMRGTAWRMLSFSRSASVVARLSRSPVPTASTSDRGSPSTRRTKFSRVRARTRSPSSVAWVRAARARRAWPTRMATKARASTSTWPVVVPSLTDSTRCPSSRGPIRLATRAAANSPKVTASRRPSPRRKTRVQARTSARPASGSLPPPDGPVGPGTAEASGPAGGTSVGVVVMRALLPGGRCRRGRAPRRGGPRGRRRLATVGCR